MLADSLLKRLSLWWVLGIAVLAAIAVEHLLRARGQRLRGLRLAVLVWAAVLALLLALDWDLTVDRDAASLARLLIPLVLGVLAVSVAPRRLLATQMLVLTLLPQVALFRSWVPQVSTESFYPPTPAIAFVQERLREADAASSSSAGYRIAGLDSALAPHAAAFFGLEEARGYDPMVFAPYAHFFSHAGELRRGEWSRLTTASHPVLDFLGVRYLFDQPTMYVFHRPGIRRVWEGEDALVYENPRALPRVFIPREAEIFVAPEAALRAAGAIEDFSRRVTASGPGLPPSGIHQNVPPGGASPEVRNLDVRAGAVQATVVSTAPTLVATSQPAIPGWRLRVDGRVTPPARINGAFLGVFLEPGEHHLELTYRPRSWNLGRGLFLVGVLTLLGGVQVARRRGHRRPKFWQDEGEPG